VLVQLWNKHGIKYIVIVVGWSPTNDVSLFYTCV
jgi:hypothetical protein